MLKPAPKLDGGEREAIEEVLKYARIYGYGNLIAHLKTAWAKSLHYEHCISKEHALKAVGVEPYSF